MKNKKNSKNRPARKGKTTTTVVKQKGAGRRPAQPTKPKPTQQEISMVCAFTDPFCDHAIGAKWPDGARNRSITKTTRVLINLYANANGNACTLFLPAYNYFYANGVHVSGTLYDFSTAPMFTAGNSSTEKGFFRIVSWGFKLHNTATPLTSSGTVSIRSLQWLDGDYFAQYVDGRTFLADYSKDIPLQDCHNVSFIGKRATEVNQYIDVNYANQGAYPIWWYTDPTTTLTSATGAVTSNWNPVTVTLTNAPYDSSPVEVELICHYEFVPEDKTTMVYATPAAKANPALINVVHKVEEKRPSTFTTNAYNVASSIAGIAAEKLGEMALRAVAKRAGVPLLME